MGNCTSSPIKLIQACRGVIQYVSDAQVLTTNYLQVKLGELKLIITFDAMLVLSDNANHIVSTHLYNRLDLVSHRQILDAPVIFLHHGVEKLLTNNTILRTIREEYNIIVNRPQCNKPKSSKLIYQVWNLLRKVADSNVATKMTACDVKTFRTFSRQCLQQRRRRQHGVF